MSDIKQRLRYAIEERNILVKEWLKGGQEKYPAVITAEQKVRALAEEYRKERMLNCTEVSR